MTIYTNNSHRFIETDQPVLVLIYLVYLHHDYLHFYK